MITLVQILMAVVIIVLVLIQKNYNFKAKKRRFLFNILTILFSFLSFTFVVGYHLGFLFPEVNTEDHMKANQWNHYVQGFKIGSELKAKGKSSVTLITPQFNSGGEMEILRGIREGAGKKIVITSVYLAMPTPQQKLAYLENHPDFAISFKSSPGDIQNAMLENTAAVYDRTLKACAKAKTVVLLALPEDSDQMEYWSVEGPDKPSLWVLNADWKVVDGLLAKHAIELACAEKPRLTYAERVLIPSYDAGRDFEARFVVKP